jgi:hypothetical protein
MNLKISERHLIIWALQVLIMLVLSLMFSITCKHFNLYVLSSTDLKPVVKFLYTVTNKEFYALGEP